MADFPLAEFYKNIRPFAFIAGYKQQKLDPEDRANFEAARIMAELHDALKAGHYTGHELRVFLVRILFCLFAKDTGSFGQPRQFELYLINHTEEAAQGVLDARAKFPDAIARGTVRSAVDAAHAHQGA